MQTLFVTLKPQQERLSDVNGRIKAFSFSLSLSLPHHHTHMAKIFFKIHFKSLRKLILFSTPLSSLSIFNLHGKDGKYEENPQKISLLTLNQLN